MVSDKTTTTTGLAAGSTEQVSLSTAGATSLNVYVDDNAGNAAATYDLDVEVGGEDGSNQMLHDSVTGSTARRHSYDAVPHEVTVTLTNSSGGAADYRIRVVAD